MPALKQRCAPDINLRAQALWDMGGRLLKANDAYLELIGSNHEELLRGQLYWNDLSPARYADRDRRTLEEIRNSGRCAPFEKEIWSHSSFSFELLRYGGAALKRSVPRE